MIPHGVSEKNVEIEKKCLTAGKVRTTRLLSFLSKPSTQKPSNIYWFLEMLMEDP